MTPFELGKILYEARVREAWNFGGTHADDRLSKHPYPRHPADADPRCDSAEIQLAQAQARTLLKVCTVARLTEPPSAGTPTEGER